jgi:DNA-binding transcriptional LysR family regulator
MEDRFDHVLTQDQLVFCVTKNHALSGSSSLRIQDLANERMLFFNADSVQNQILNFRFEAIHVTPRVVMRSSQLYTTLKFLEQGDCGCFLLQSMLHQFPSLIGIPIDPPIQANIGLVWKKGKYVSNHMQKFLDFTIRTCSSEPNLSR